MAVLKMLSKVIRPEEFFRMVALSEFMDIHQVLDPNIPVTFRDTQVVVNVHRSSAALKFVTAVSTDVQHSRRAWRVVKCIGIVGESGTRPRVTPEMKRILVALCFVFVLESVLAIGALILFLGLVCTIIMVRQDNLI